MLPAWRAHAIMAQPARRKRGTSSAVIAAYLQCLKSCDPLQAAEIVRDFRGIPPEDMAYSFYEALYGAAELLAHYEAHLDGGLNFANVHRSHAALLAKYDIRTGPTAPPLLGTSPHGQPTKKRRRDPK